MVRTNAATWNAFLQDNEVWGNDGHILDMSISINGDNTDECILAPHGAAVEILGGSLCSIKNSTGVEDLCAIFRGWRERRYGATLQR